VNDWQAWNTNSLAMYDAIATMQAYRHGPPIEPDRVIALDGSTRVYHGHPVPYVQRYPGWTTQGARS
jgi:hypothetical protein